MCSDRRSISLARVSLEKTVMDSKKSSPFVGVSGDCSTEDKMWRQMFREDSRDCLVVGATFVLPLSSIDGRLTAPGPSLIRGVTSRDVTGIETTLHAQQGVRLNCLR
jgi:hypothetical protein